MQSAGHARRNIEKALSGHFAEMARLSPLGKGGFSGYGETADGEPLLLFKSQSAALNFAADVKDGGEASPVLREALLEVAPVLGIFERTSKPKRIIGPLFPHFG